MSNIRINGKVYTQEEVEEIFNKQRVRILSKYVDKHYILNPEFIIKIENFMDGNIKSEIFEGLDNEFNILRDDPNDENITKMIDDKVEKFIADLYE